MNQHDVTQPIKVEQGPARTNLETALAALDNRTSQVIHLSPSQAEAIWMEIIRLREIEALYDGLDSFWGKDDFPE